MAAAATNATARLAAAALAATQRHGSAGRCSARVQSPLRPRGCQHGRRAGVRRAAPPSCSMGRTRPTASARSSRPSQRARLSPAAGRPRRRWWCSA
eukprot:620908-Prymnesium_polylepis.1